MKTCTRHILLAALAVTFSTGRLHAGDEAWAALGGFVAGVITGAVIEDADHCETGLRVAVGDRYGRWDRYGHHDRYDRRDTWDRYDRRDRHYKQRPSGHWEVRHVKVWVPGGWVVEVNRCGDRIRVWRPGYFDLLPRKVWVPYDGHGGRHCD